jgi:hypothetical protein
MKVAVLLFGHLRTYEYCAPLLKKHILDNYDCDVFMHTWSDSDSDTISWNESIRSRNSRPVSKDVIDRINELYASKKLTVENQKVKNDIIVKSIANDDKNSLLGMNFMFESMGKTNKLRHIYEEETGAQYDAVIVVRPDVMIMSFIDIKKAFDEALVLGIDIENVRFFAGLSPTTFSRSNITLQVHRGNDFLFFARPKVIDRYIAANTPITKEMVGKHYIKATTIYTANEIAAGISPMQISFEYGRHKDFYILRDGEDAAPAPAAKSKLYRLLHLYWLRGKK